MIYIDNGKTVKMFYTSKEVENELLALLVEKHGLDYEETHEGCGVNVAIKERRFEG